MALNPTRLTPGHTCPTLVSLVAPKVSERLHRALRLPGYTPERVAAMYGQLARVCLETMRISFADLVLERAQARSLPVGQPEGRHISIRSRPAQFTSFHNEDECIKRVIKADMATQQCAL